MRWFLSVDPVDLPFKTAPGKRSTYRSITVDGKEIKFSDGFTDLHTEVYRQILAGNDCDIEDARTSIHLTHQIRTCAVTDPGESGSPNPKKSHGVKWHLILFMNPVM